jgi:RNA polymerase sigma-70 factor (ECF subfamily)
MADTTPARDDQLRLHLLVLRCQAGDERAFGQLLGEFGARTLRYLHGLVGDDADDVQQEVWLSVYRAIVTLANPGAFRTWLFSTTRRRALDHLRKRRREQELIIDAPDEGRGIPDVPDDAALDAVDAFDANDLGNVLAGLPPPQREVLLLRFQDQMSYSEIAVIVGCPVGTVKTRIHHAKRKLHDILSRGSS